MNNDIYPNLGLIVAMGNNYEIGYQNKLIWPIKEDLQYFKNVTMHSFIIMGRTTYETMPKNLKGRKYIVLSHNPNIPLDNDKLLMSSVESTLEYVNANPNHQFWVIGGGKIYQEFLPFVQTMHLTQINASFTDADTFFPIYPQEEFVWRKGPLLIEDNISYTHNVLTRKKES